MSLKIITYCTNLIHFGASYIIFRNYDSSQYLTYMCTGHFHLQKHLTIHSGYSMPNKLQNKFSLSKQYYIAVVYYRFA